MTKTTFEITNRKGNKAVLTAINLETKMATIETSKGSKEIALTTLVGYKAGQRTINKMVIKEMYEKLNKPSRGRKSNPETNHLVLMVKENCKPKGYSDEKYYATVDSLVESGMTKDEAQTFIAKTMKWKKGS